ncbi:uncharacterized protein LOC128715210 [Anopheles marshallii]|uniref:uncharacterized protein LOC128715210 n=1 Tax=Anopheles marshallii TaxID=1521116 RepID=UPI00237A4015|nr:uncharacterized protein LOC128715210 [Anopheles marshallii]
MEHDIVRLYSDDRVKISGWSERIQQYPYDFPSNRAGRAAYRTLGYTTKHFIPRTSTQAMSDTVWGQFQQRQLAQNRTKKPLSTVVKLCPYITTYQDDYFDRFPAFRKLMMINALQGSTNKRIPNPLSLN